MTEIKQSANMEDLLALLWQDFAFERIHQCGVMQGQGGAGHTGRCEPIALTYSNPQPQTNMKTTVKVVTSTGESWVTEINATLDEAKDYFMCHRFERDDETLMGPVVSVELLSMSNLCSPISK